MSFRKHKRSHLRNQISDKNAWKLVEQNIGLVHKIAYKFSWMAKSCNVLDYEDLVQEGLLGLYRAAQLYNPKLKFKFSTYAWHWIEQYIRRSHSDLGFKCVRIPVYVTEKFSELRKKFGDDFDVEELYRTKKISKSEYDAFVVLGNGAVELDKESSNAESDGSSLMDFIMVNEHTMVHDKLEHLDMHAMVMIACEKLKDKEAAVVAARFGLNGEDALSLEQCGAEFGFTRERSRQIQQKAIDKMRAYFQRNTRLFDELKELANRNEENRGENVSVAA